MTLSVVILAAGEGKRMRAELPKVLYPLAGVPLLERIIKTAQKIDAHRIYVVYGGNKNQFCENIDHSGVIWVKQPEPLGTGHAVMQTLDKLEDDHRVLVLYGDTPLISIETLKQLLIQTPHEAMGWLTAHVADPTGLGRIIRDDQGNPQAIVEEKDATDFQKVIHEINTGICLVPVKYLKEWLPILKNDNAQREYYLPDIFGIARQRGIEIQTIPLQSEMEILAVNNQVQLAQLERVFQRQAALEYMEQGLRLLDPERFDVRGYFTFSRNVTIDINVIIEGEVSIGSNCYIGPNVVLKDVIIGNNVEIKANSVIEDAIIGNGCLIGPFARVRPGTRLKSNVKIGNFVEIKKSEIGKGTKVNHLSYIGDATLGEYINVGAGMVTCNYDGVRKYQTIVNNGAFIGSSTVLIPPIEIGKEAYIGAGSVITEDVPDGKLTLARAKQTTIEHWVSPKKRGENEQK